VRLSSYHNIPTFRFFKRIELSIFFLGYLGNRIIFFTEFKWRFQTPSTDDARQLWQFITNTEHTKESDKSIKDKVPITNSIYRRCIFVPSGTTASKDLQNKFKIQTIWQLSMGLYYEQCKLHFFFLVWFLKF